MDKVNPHEAVAGTEREQVVAPAGTLNQAEAVGVRQCLELSRRDAEESRLEARQGHTANRPGTVLQEPLQAKYLHWSGVS